MAEYKGKGTGGYDRQGSSGGSSGGSGSKPPFKDNNKGGYAPPINLPKGYLSNGYNTEEGKRDVRYITEYPLQISKFLVEFKDATAYSKMRSYYDEAVSTRDLYFQKRYSMDVAVGKIAQLINRAKNSTEKGNMHDNFKQFICKNVEYVVSVTDEKQFRIVLGSFIDHFEAVICLVYRKKQK